MELTSKFDNAVGLAWRVHYGQRDKQGEPYILHVMRVINNVRKMGWTGDYLIAAALHDVLEDGDPAPSVGELKKLFGLDVAQAVVMLTKEEDESYEKYIDAVNKDHMARIVKLADIEDHLSRFKAEEFHKHRKYLDAKVKLTEGGGHVNSNHVTM